MKHIANRFSTVDVVHPHSYLGMLSPSTFISWNVVFVFHSCFYFLQGFLVFHAFLLRLPKGAPHHWHGSSRPGAIPLPAGSRGICSEKNTWRFVNFVHSWLCPSRFASSQAESSSKMCTNCVLYILEYPPKSGNRCRLSWMCACMWNGFQVRSSE